LILHRCRAEPAIYNYTSKAGTDYFLNTSLTSQPDAQATCNTWGGHLVILTSNSSEQIELENYFVKSGGLIPSYHQFYWSGLYTDDASSGFR
jgi:hypothetical protein